MKKALRITALIIGLLLLLLITLPWLFQDKIKALVLEEAQKSLKATVSVGDVGLSFLRNFPSATVSIHDFSIVGQDQFDTDTLAQGKTLRLVVDLMDVIQGETLNLKAIDLDQPKLKLLVLEDGMANWDIVKEDTAAVPTGADTSSSNLHIALKRYALRNATIVYDDATLPMTLRLKGTNHQGSGNFTLSDYDLDTETNIEQLFVSYDNITYLNNIQASADAVLGISIDPIIKMAFKQNRFFLNDMVLSLDGLIEMPGDDIVMDLKYGAQETGFGNLLSLVPGVYTADFKDIKTDGEIAFEGFVKGTYNETRIPGFGVDLQVDNAMFQYPDVPTPVTGIVADVKVNNPDGDLEKTLIDIRKFHMDFGANPIDVQARIEGMERMKVEGKALAHLDLGQLSQMFPLEGTTLKGKFDIDAEADGIYDSAKGTFPKMAADMKLTDGYLKQAEYPAELTELSMEGSLQDPDGQMTHGTFELPQFHFLLDGEPVDGSLFVKNFENPSYILQANGVLDLEKLMQIYPIDSMTLAGKILVDHFETKGTYSDIEAERYTNLPTSGTVRVQNLSYDDADLEKPVEIEKGQAVFTPQQISLSGVQGKSGRSDFAMDGSLTNYVAYALMDDAPLGGNITLRSNRLDINEFMGEESSTSSGSESSGEEAALEVIPVPANLNIGMQADIAEVIYDDLSIKNMQGRLRVADETVAMEGLNFSMLGGDFAMSGAYATPNPRRPDYSFFIDIKDLIIQQAFQSFSVMQSFAPALEAVNGIVNTDFGIKGQLNAKMMPVMESINSEGLFAVVKGGLQSSGLLGKIGEKAKLNGLTPADIKDLSGKFEIRDGSLIISPLDFMLGSTILTLGGSQSLTGALNYEVKIDAPSGALDQAAIGALSGLSGTTLQTSDRVSVNLLVSGTREDLNVKGGGGGTSDQVKDQLTDVAEGQLKDKLDVDVELDKDSLKAQAGAATETVKDSVKTLVEDTKTQVQDSLKTVADKAKEEAKEKAGDAVEEALGTEAKEKLDELKDKFGLPKLGKKKKKKE